jgi:protein-L-isoaspartate(D-aspartate) O-methyltransferase
MQGIGAHTERLVSLDGDDVGLRVDAQQPVDADRLREALFQPRVQRWSGVELGGVEPIDNLDLWLATVVDGFGLLTAKKHAIDSGLVASSARAGAKAIMAGGTFAYRAPARPLDPDRTRFELDAYAHGPEAEVIAKEYVELLQRWDRDHRGGARGRASRSIPQQPHMRTFPWGGSSTRSTRESSFHGPDGGHPDRKQEFSQQQHHHPRRNL